ncbi:MAG: hypothetical protein OXG30_10455 [bacterium]|nr:hypothetical protein [bacterium]
MIVLDAYLVIGLLRDEPVADETRQLLESLLPAWLTPLGMSEVVDRRVRLDEVDPEAVFVNLVQFGLANPMPLDSQTAARAGALRARYCHRKTRSVSLADTVGHPTCCELVGTVGRTMQSSLSVGQVPPHGSHHFL